MSSTFPMLQFSVSLLSLPLHVTWSVSLFLSWVRDEWQQNMKRIVTVGACCYIPMALCREANEPYCESQVGRGR